MSYWRRSKTSALEAKYYSMHGPQSTISLCPSTQRMSYAANFSAKMPQTIDGRIQSDQRLSPDADTLNYFVKLAERLSKSPKA